MTAAAISFRDSILPWSLSPADEARFRRILNRVLIASAVVCLILLFMPRPVEDRAAPVELPPRIAKLVLEREPPPPPPPAVVRQERSAAETPKTEKAAPEAPKAKPEPVQSAAVPEARNPQPNKAPGENLERARQKAQGVGLLSMKNELAQLSAAPVAVQLNQDIKPGRGIGSGSGPGVGAGAEAGVPVRSLITSNAAAGSGGINTAAYSRDTGGGGLAGRSTTLVEGTIGGGGGGGAGGGLGVGGKGNGAGSGSGGGAGGTLAKGSSGKASRSIEEIKLVFERNKGAIYAIYNRALRDDPSLQGKVVLKLTISPAGSVVDVRVESTELKASELEAKLLARIRSFDFGAKEVDQMVVTWPVDFLPS